MGRIGRFDAMKHRTTRRVRAITLLALLVLVAGPHALAKFMHIWEPVPLDRLLTNVVKYVREHPNDAAGTYTLGRLHSLAFAQSGKDAKAGVITKDPRTRKPLPLPG